MSALLSVVEGNPRRGHRRRTRRKGHAKARRTRRHRVHARAANPVRHRRRRVMNTHHRRRRHHNPRRRRHRNPLLAGGMVGTLIKGATIGLGVVAANVATAAANNFVFKGTMAGPTKLALKAGVGVAGYFALNALKQRGFATAFLIGAGVSVALDAYDQFVKPAVVSAAPWLADYNVGSLQGYQVGQLQGWAPQGGMSGWAPQGLSGEGDAYAQGAYN